MSRIGLFCYLGSGHLNPMAALGRKLKDRGHSVVVFHQANARGVVKAAGLEFALLRNMAAANEVGCPVGAFDSFASFLAQEPMHSHAAGILANAPSAVRSAQVDALIIDQHDIAAATVAEHLRLPFVTAAIVPPLYCDPSVPPCFTGWAFKSSRLARLRNSAGIFCANLATSRTRRLLNRQRILWGLSPLRGLNDCFSRSLIVSQLPASFDFPYGERICHTGPFHDPSIRHRIPFPWERLNGKPLVYVSLGTVRNASPALFRTVLAACEALPVQVVISLGGGPVPCDRLEPEREDTIVVDYAPQIEVIRAASLVVTHGGINTTLESLASGKPLVVIPIADDQPGVASRVVRAGAGQCGRVRNLRPETLSSVIAGTLRCDTYRAAARRCQSEILSQDGPAVASEAIEKALGLSVCTPSE